MRVKRTPEEKVQIELFSKFAALGASVGCQPDQIENFLKSGVVLQSKQLEIAGKCRECDNEDGPKMILAGGGRGSAKSHAILAQIFCDDCQRVPNLKVLCLRKVGRANKEQIQDFRKKLLTYLPHTYREQQQTITFQNGSLVILGNFKDEKDIDKYLGLEYDLIYIMESNQLTQSKKINILSCLRTNKTNWRPRCYQDTNPGGIDHVANKLLFVDPWKIGKETETRYIHSTVDDNKFVDSGYKEYLEKLVGWQREAWLHGSWEFMAGAFFSNFHADIHVYPNEVTQLNERAVMRWFAGLDYGYSHPNAFVLCCEDEDGNIFCVAEYSQSNTLIEEHASNIRDLLAMHHLEVEELEFIAAGKDCFRVDKDGSTVATEYMEHSINLTPVHIDRINSWSQVAEIFGDISHQIKPRCFIHKNCVNLISQIQSAQCDPKKPNDILKMNADAESGEGGDDSLECLVGETLITTKRGEIPIRDVSNKDEVLTSCGWRRVVFSGMTSSCEDVFEVTFSNNKKIIGTANHPIWTERGWVTIESLRNTDIVSICFNQNLKQSYSTEENLDDIHNQRIVTCDPIISPARSKIWVKACRYIKKFGNQLMEKFRKAFIYIIKTEIASTTKSEILNAYPAKSMHKDIKTILQENQKSSFITLQKFGSPLPLGTSQKNVANLPKKIGQRRLGNFLYGEITNASFAEKILNQEPVLLQSSATQTAKRLKKEKVDDILKKESALSVERRLRPTKVEKPKLAHANVMEIYAVGQSSVFNLQVEDCPEYFANGFLVHNCFRNSVVMAYSSLLKTARPIQMGGYRSLTAPLPEDNFDVERVIEFSEKLDDEIRRTRY